MQASSKLKITPSAHPAGKPFLFGLSIMEDLVRLTGEGLGGPIPMQYLLLIYDKESEWGTLTEAQQSAMMKEYQDFTKSINESGHWRASSQLHPVSKATTVRIRDGKKMVTDGPFAETKEQLGGFYLVEAKDLDEAVALAARVPSARFGSIEVRPLVGRNRP